MTIGPLELPPEIANDPLALARWANIFRALAERLDDPRERLRGRAVSARLERLALAAAGLA